MNTQTNNAMVPQDALNLFTFALSRNLERNVLECNGNYHIADLVTKIIRGVFSSLYRHLFRLSKDQIPC